jgi:hypothetical protein
MASYTVDLTPSLVTFSSEASLDTSLLNGLSKQRTLNATLLVNSSDQLKMVGRLNDGDTYNDVVTVVSRNISAGNPNVTASGSTL